MPELPPADFIEANLPHAERKALETQPDTHGCEPMPESSTHGGRPMTLRDCMDAEDGSREGHAELSRLIAEMRDSAQVLSARGYHDWAADLVRRANNFDAALGESR